jgi:hypothetical protein
MEVGRKGNLSQFLKSQKWNLAELKGKLGYVSVVLTNNPTPPTLRPPEVRQLAVCIRYSTSLSFIASPTFKPPSAQISSFQNGQQGRPHSSSATGQNRRGGLLRGSATDPCRRISLHQDLQLARRHRHPLQCLPSTVTCWPGRQRRRSLCHARRCLQASRVEARC